MFEKNSNMGRKKIKCGKCSNCLSGRWEKKCTNPSVSPRKVQTKSPPKKKKSPMIIKKRAAFDLASISFPKKKIQKTKNNNAAGFWARKVTDDPEQLIRRKRSSISAVSKRNQQLKAPTSKPSGKEEVIEALNYFGIGEKLGDRLKGKMFFCNSPSKLSKGRKSELVKVGKTLIHGILSLIHPQPEKVMDLVLKGKGKSNTSEIKQSVMMSATFQRVVEEYHAATSKNEKYRLLSILKPDFTRDQLSQLLGKKFSWYKYRIISHHADVWGPGATKINLPYTGLKYSDTDIEEVLNFILSPECIQNLAVGEHRIVNSDGTESFLPNFQRVYDEERLWKMFHGTQQQGQMSRSTFLSIVKLVTGNQQKQNDCFGCCLS